MRSKTKSGFVQNRLLIYVFYSFLKTLTAALILYFRSKTLELGEMLRLRRALHFQFTLFKTSVLHEYLDEVVVYIYVTLSVGTFVSFLEISVIKKIKLIWIGARR